MLTLDRTVGLEAALAAGIAAARGELVVATGVGKEYPVQQIPHLIAELSRTDIVFGRQKRVGWAHAWQQFTGLPQRWLLGPEVRSTDCLFWAARREAVAGLESARGTARFCRGWWQCEGFAWVRRLSAFSWAKRRIRELWPHPADLLAVWWLRRRYRPAKIEELRAGVADGGNAVVARPSHWIDARPESQPARGRHAPAWQCLRLPGRPTQCDNL